MIPQAMELMYLQIHWSFSSTKIWLLKNHLNVSNSKTQTFSVGLCKYDLELSMDRTKRDIANNVKILGVTLNSKLKF